MSNSYYTNNQDRILDMMFERKLKQDHPRYQIQKDFIDFVQAYPEVDLHMSDLYNNGGCVSLHLQNEEFIIVCDMDAMEIESSILLDYEDVSFNEIETIPFNWESLKLRLNDMLSITPWTRNFKNCKDVNEARKKATDYLRNKWKTK
jgi:hypothetical protein